MKLNFIQEHFKVDPDESLSSKDNAISHAVTMMLENHTAVAGFHWRYGYNNAEFCDKVLSLLCNRGNGMLVLE